MQKQQYTIEIHAPREKVWDTLWSDTTFRDWAAIIDEGSYMVGELKEGNRIQFNSSVSGYGVTSFVAKCTPHEYVLFKQLKDTKNNGEEERDNEWTGGEESYTLTETDGVTTLTIASDIPPELEETFKERLPKALERIKVLAEK